jgi:hypothetical protein
MILNVSAKKYGEKWRFSQNTANFFAELAKIDEIRSLIKKLVLSKET